MIIHFLVNISLAEEKERENKGKEINNSVNDNKLSWRAFP